jgi:ribulose-bisphosphate carboxylase large chain
MNPYQISPALSGERFQVHYRLTGNEAETREKARDICLEQTVEFPDDLVPDGDIRDQIVGRIESLEPSGEGRFDAVISYLVESAGAELTQFLNVVFGNISIKPGIRVERLELPPGWLRHFKGPRFGREKLREWLAVPDRPLLCTALKPMGLSARDLANYAYQFALGGIDMIKDDHGLADQPFAPFRERVERCAEAVTRANRETGRRCVYMPNVTASADQVLEKALFAKNAGAGALLVAPGLVGFDTMRQLADDDRIGLPIMSHPTLQGSFVTSPDNGISHFVLFGQLARLAGADATIFPSWGGRFAFSRDECRSIAEGVEMPMEHIRSIYCAPGGGMTLQRIPEMLDVYGNDVIFLVGGGLHRHSPDLVENSRYFLQLVSQFAPS